MIELVSRPKSQPVPMDLTLRGVIRTPNLEAIIGRWVARLEDACSELQRCKVLIERVRSLLRSDTFRIRLEVTIEQQQISVVPPMAYADIHQAVADAFRMALCVIQ